MIFSSVLLRLAAVSSLSFSAHAIPLAEYAPPTPSCTNGPTSRGCWSDGFNIDTDYYKSWPNTGRVVEVSFAHSPRTSATVTLLGLTPEGQYHWEITNQTLAPDGFERVVLAVNGQFPGPLVEANWGDTIGTSLALRGEAVQYIVLANDGGKSFTSPTNLPGTARRSTGTARVCSARPKPTAQSLSLSVLSR